MGKCKICGTGIDDTEEMCDDCKALDDVDLIKSDDELEELLNSVMHSHASYPNNDGDSFQSSVEMTIDPIKEIDNQKDSDEISVQLDSIANDLLEQYNFQDVEPLSVDSISSEGEEPFSLDSFSEGEEPFSLDSLSEEEEPFSLDSLSEEEEPFSIDTLSEEEEAFSIDSLTSEEESSEKEEPFAIDSFMEGEESDTTNMDMDLHISALHSGETAQVDNGLYAGIPGFEGIFDGIDDEKEASDVSDIFADVLGTVSNYGADEEENNGNQIGKDKKKSTKKKNNFIKGIFENIKNEETEKEFLKEKELAEVKAVQKAAKKEQKIASTATKKAKKAEAKKLKLAVKAAKKAEKESKIEEEELDHSKINKKGATVVFVAFAAICAMIILGTNTFSYSASIGQAEDYLARRKYTKAYGAISGVDIKADDQELANKIKTIMYVNKEYDSYNNYYAIQYYAEALNSLLNGLTKYDVYLEQASELGVKSDLQYVKSQILEELQEKYNLDEEGAKKITGIEDQEKYSDKVFSIAEKLVEDKKK